MTTTKTEAIELLSRYLKIDTTNPPGNESAGAAFFAEIFAAEQIACRTYAAVPGRESISARLTGSGEKPPLVLLNHIDVVLAEKAQWHFDPFGGAVENGYIHGRGAVDMKGLAIIELIAFLDIARSKATPNRDIIFLAVADEEAGGRLGAKFLMDHHAAEFEAGLVLNEGGLGVLDALPDRPVMLIAVAEKACNWIRLNCQGPPGHGSLPNPENALERLIRGLARLQTIENPIRITPVTAEYFRRLAVAWDFLKPYREDDRPETLIACLEKSGMTAIPQIAAMIRNTVSTNVIAAGSKTNVIPSTATAEVDVRLLPGEDPDAFLAKVRHQLADDRIEIEFIEKDRALVSPIDTEGYQTINQVLGRHFTTAVIAPSLLMGSSDSRFFRERGITAYGVMPIMMARDDIKMVHGIDEKISIENLTRGTAVYTDLVRTLCGL